MLKNVARCVVGLSCLLFLSSASQSYADDAKDTGAGFLKIRDSRGQDPVLDILRSRLNIKQPVQATVTVPVKEQAVAAPAAAVSSVIANPVAVVAPDAAVKAIEAAPPSNYVPASPNSAASSRSESRRHDKHASKLETDYHGWNIDNGKCKISCVDPHAACTESEHVLDTLKILFKAYSKGDFETAAKYMDDGVTTFDESTKTLIVGKEAVIKDLKSRIQVWESSDSPLVSYTMEHPYAKVTGDVAVVSFVAVKVFGGKHPQKLESRCTDIFKKENGKWKKLHYRSSWKEVT